MMGFVGLLKLAVKCLDVLAWPVFGLAYPLYASIQAIETNSISDTQKLITYWVSISVVLLCEYVFQLEWLTFWPYIKLMIVICLVLPYFDGSLYAYKHLVHPCLSMGPRTITCQFNKLEELFFKKDDFLVEVKGYMKENGSDALEDLIASMKKSAKPNVAVNEIGAAAAEDWSKFEQPKLQVPFKHSNALEITEKIEVASTKQQKFEQAKLPVRFKDSHAVEITEEKEVASTVQVRQIESNTDQTENRTFPPLENLNTATTTVGGRDLYETLPAKKVQKEWICAICQVTAPNETVLNLHLQGKRHKAAPERLKVNNHALEITEKIEVASTKQQKFEQAKLPVRLKGSNAVEITEKKEVASTKQHKFEQAKFPVRFNDSNAVEITEKKEVASTMQLKCEQAKLPVRFNESNAVEITEKNEVASTNQVRQIESNTDQTENRIFPPLENINTATTTVGGRDLYKTLPAEKVQKEWTCAMCQVTTQSETVLNSHLQGKRHKAAFERLKVNNHALKITEKIEVASTKQLKFEQPKLPVRLKDSNAEEITEKKEVASTVQQKFEQAKLPVRFKDSKAVEITEKKEVASTKQDHIAAEPLIPPPTISSADGTTTESNPAYLAWRKLNQLILSWINATVKREILPLLYWSKSASEAWHALESHFLDKSTARELQLKLALNKLRKDDLSIDAYCQRFKEIADALAAINQPMSDREQVTRLLQGLPTSYESLITVASNQKPSPSFTELWTMLLNHEARLEHMDSVSSHVSAQTQTALFTTPMSSITGDPSLGYSHRNSPSPRGCYQRGRGRSGRGRGGRHYSYSFSSTASSSPSHASIRGGRGILGSAPLFSSPSSHTSFSGSCFTCGLLGQMAANCPQ